MDAMSEKYSSWSPYNYAINNPVMVIDPDGNDIQSPAVEAAQSAFRAYVATMSTSTEETSGENLFTGFNFDSPPNDYIFDEKGKYVRTDINNLPHRFVIENSKSKIKDYYSFVDPIQLLKPKRFN